MLCSVYEIKMQFSFSFSNFCLLRMEFKRGHRILKSKKDHWQTQILIVFCPIFIWVHCPVRNLLVGSEYVMSMAYKTQILLVGSACLIRKKLYGD
ncbi:hypothetical protein BRARA_D00471 [Brassica rapa]|uniref:Uncharacterized protein n=1 Tax=Brassica campestris TaxID=3711 RepID=A0A397ZLN2_BRACM|nr:hypothetical protein BRARA_D00471 [Brassica rapa]